MNEQENILGNLEMNLSTRNYQKIKIVPQGDGEINLNTLSYTNLCIKNFFNLIIFTNEILNAKLCFLYRS